MAIADIRREYSQGNLQRTDLEANPVAQFQKWFAQAAGEASGSYWRKIGIALFKLWHAILGHAPTDPTAMVLSTTRHMCPPLRPPPFSKPCTWSGLWP